MRVAYYLKQRFALLPVGMLFFGSAILFPEENPGGLSFS
jgi:hypothetical protein